MARSEAVARRSRSKTGDSSLCSEQAPQSRSSTAEIATLPLVARNDNTKPFNAFAIISSFQKGIGYAMSILQLAFGKVMEVFPHALCPMLYAMFTRSTTRSPAFERGEGGAAQGEP